MKLTVQSGIGRELGLPGLGNYLEIKSGKTVIVSSLKHTVCMSMESSKDVYKGTPVSTSE